MGDPVKGGLRRHVLKQLGVQPDRTSQNESFRLCTLFSTVVKIGTEWAQRITDGGSGSGRAGKSAESFAASVSARRMIHTSRRRSHVCRPNFARPPRAQETSASLPKMINRTLARRLELLEKDILLQTRLRDGNLSSKSIRLVTAQLSWLQHY